MRVRALDNNNDWTFGAGKANYISGIAALNQKVITRIKSFKNDNPLNMDSNIDWIYLLGNRSTTSTILKEIERVVIDTDGVIKVNDVSLIKLEDRVADIQVSYDTIYGKSSVEIAEL